MNEPILTRIDFRLVHGQVATYWVKQYNIDRILIVDDTTKKDEFLKDVLKMTVPQGCTIEFFGVDEAADLYMNDQLGIKAENDHTLLLFKTIKDAYDAYGKGMKVSYLQIGNSKSGPGKTAIANMYFISQEEAKQLDELSEAGVEIAFHCLGNLPKEDWKDIRKKYFIK